MRITTKKILAIALVGVMVASAGCASWGTDGPADESDGSDTGDDLEEAENDTNTSEDDSATDSSTDSSDSGSDSDTSSTSSGGDDSPDSDGTPDESDSSDEISSDQSDGESGDKSEDSTGTSDDEPQDPGDDGSSDGDSTTDSDSTSDSDSDQQDSKDSTDSDSDGSDSDSSDKDLPDEDTSDGDSDTSDGAGGTDGTDGDDGTDGSDGTDGTDGDDGTDGTDGDDGTDGSDGNDTTDPAPDPDTHELKVTVTDHRGNPIEGASVEVATADRGDEVASGETDSDGIATFDLESGEYDVTATYEYKNARGDTVSRVTVDGDTDADLMLDLSDGLATGKVIVTDQNGNPVEGEPVILSPPGTVDDEGKVTEHTNENGQVVIELAAGDPSDVVMYGVEVRDQEKTLAIMADAHTEIQEVTFEVDTSDQMYEFERTVRVVDQNGDPVTGEPVEARHLGVEEWSDVGPTDENGEVVLTASSSESGDAYAFDVRVAGETTTGIAVDNQDRETVVIERTVENGGEPETHALDVTVTDPNGDPVEGASVSIVTYDGGADVASGTTNSDGIATFNLENGDYEAVVTTEDDDLLQPSDQRLVTINGEDASLDVQMQSSGDNGNGSGNGKETYTLTVHAESAVTLESTDEDGMSETKEPTDGVVTFEVPAGAYVLTADGYVRADLPFVEEDTEITLQDNSGATMDISVVDAETGEPVEGAEMSGECALWNSGGDSYIETTSASGSDGIVTVQTGVTPTTCEPTVTATGYESTTIGLTVPDDDGMTVELQPVETAVPEPPENETDVNETNGNATAALA